MCEYVTHSKTTFSGYHSYLKWQVGRRAGGGDIWAHFLNSSFPHLQHPITSQFTVFLLLPSIPPPKKRQDRRKVVKVNIKQWQRQRHNIINYECNRYSSTTYVYKYVCLCYAKEEKKTKRNGAVVVSCELGLLFSLLLLPLARPRPTYGPTGSQL